MLKEVTDMGHKVTLEMPEDIYESLQKIAEETGRTPEGIIAQWVGNDVRQAENDPLMKWVGGLDSGIPNWADEHDKYVGEAILQHMRDEID